MKRFHMSLSDAEAHQRKHGFIPVRGPVITQAAVKEPVSGSFRQIRRKLKMTKTEREFSLILEARKRKGEIDDWKFQPIKFWLADGCFYTPDFMVIVDDVDVGRQITFVEVKGAHIWEDSTIKFKWARKEQDWAEWEMWQKKEGKWTLLQLVG